MAAEQASGVGAGSVDVADESRRVAQACEACGHIRGDHDPADRCRRCGAHPARWVTAPTEPGPVDTGEPSVGLAVAQGPTPEA